MKRRVSKFVCAGVNDKVSVYACTYVCPSLTECPYVRALDPFWAHRCKMKRRRRSWHCTAHLQSAKLWNPGSRICQGPPLMRATWGRSWVKIPHFKHYSHEYHYHCQHYSIITLNTVVLYSRFWSNGKQLRFTSHHWPVLTHTDPATVRDCIVDRRTLIPRTIPSFGITREWSIHKTSPIPISITPDGSCTCLNYTMIFNLNCFASSHLRCPLRLLPPCYISSVQAGGVSR